MPFLWTAAGAMSYWAMEAKVMENDVMDGNVMEVRRRGTFGAGAETVLSRRTVTDDERIARKRKFCRDYARRKRKELVLVHEKALLIYGELVRIGAYQQLSDEAREFFELYIHREEMQQRRYPPNMYKMFGSHIAPGVSCTLKEAMQRLYKGKNEINFIVRRWRDRNGVIIDMEPSDSGAALEMRYVIRSLGPKNDGCHDEVCVRDVMSHRESGAFGGGAARG